MLKFDKIKLDKINLINPEDRKYNNNNYVLMTFIISNAINPTFKVYASCIQDAIDILFYNYPEIRDRLFISELDLDPEELESEDNDLYSVDLGYYLDLAHFEAEEGTTGTV